MSDDNKQLVTVETFTPLAVEDMIDKLKYIEDYKQRVMEEKIDYGVIPGTQKPCLFKPGSEKLAFAFNLYAEYEVDNKVVEPFKEWEYEVWDREQKKNVTKKTRGYFHYTVRCRLFNKETGQQWGSQLANCDSLERGRETAPSNTIMKMAEKRAYVGAVLNATFTSDRFTQDVEDYKGNQSTKQQTGGNNSSGKDEGFASKYGEVGKESFCIFCKKKHVLVGDMITKDDATGKYGAVACRDKKPAEKSTGTDDNVAKYMVMELKDVISIALNTEMERIGDPNLPDGEKDIMSFRYKSVNAEILALAQLEKNSKEQLAKYIIKICDEFKLENE
jgi:hypothetical protein